MFGLILAFKSLFSARRMFTISGNSGTIVLFGQFQQKKNTFFIKIKFYNKNWTKFKINVNE